jgi:hypothetical protein
MPKSYRIRTDVGVDKSINVTIDQEFEYLEILSLKVLQSDMYTRVCSDYGVIIGRVSVNDGFGIPNAKVSIFIPLSDIDESDPIISEIYPYRSIRDVNEDGYRYNLLPYKPSYSAHVPTGTFFTREDVLTNPTLIEVYDKYYKYNAVTNQSGDFMIFGVPVGPQTLVVDIDLSDIGEFSLSPQDLVRMGIASPSQVSGTKFKASSNLRELPQIINFNRTIVVEPLWGQSEICNLGITRTDFDLSTESNINITPTAIFMGSIISSNDEDFQKKNCKPRLKSGALCSLTTGPGEILAIRQTIKQDINGYPLLETFDLEEGGQVIDDNGTWLLDVPMNLDYLITNEFGEQVISDDPKKGIPTKGKYRFKVKWAQSPSLSETIKRGYYLVPNIKEHGWSQGPSVDPLSLSSSDPDYIKAIKSYSFSVDWNDYQDIQSAINCDDTFYMMTYNKVYTVSQLITQYRKGYSSNRIVSIKDIISTDCSSDTNKFPANDALYRFDLIYFLLKILSWVFKPVLLGLVIACHLLYWTVKIMAASLSLIILIIGLVVIALCWIVKAIIWALNTVTFGSLSWSTNCPSFDELWDLIKELWSMTEFFKNIHIPNLSYPDCDVCSCSDSGTGVNHDTDAQANANQTIASSGGYGVLVPFDISTNYIILKYLADGVTPNPYYTSYGKYYEQMFTGLLWIAPGDQDNPQKVGSRVPQLVTVVENGVTPLRDIFTSSLPIDERLNLFNTKAKYFNGPQDMPTVLITGTVKISNLATPTPAAGDKMTVITISSPSLFIGAIISGSGIASNTKVLSQISGTPGGVGVYEVSVSQLVTPTNFTVPNYSTNSPHSIPNFNNPGGGVNRIKVKVEPTITGNSGKFHLDNVIAVVVKAGSSSSFATGSLLTFQDPIMAKDINLTGSTVNIYGNKAITGMTINGATSPTDFTPKPITLTYANPNGIGNDISVTYGITGTTNGARYHKFPMDLEYFQVITGMTYSDFNLLCNSTNTSSTDWENLSFHRRFLNNYTKIYEISPPPGPIRYNQFSPTPITSLSPTGYYKDMSKQYVVFLTRGVDPNSDRVNITYDLSKLFGFYNFGQAGLEVSGRYRLNHPIKGGFKTVNHSNVNSINTTDSYSNLGLYYDSFRFVPSQGAVNNFSAFTSNLISYYSSFDNGLISNTGFSPGAGAPLITLGVSQTSLGATLNPSTWSPTPIALLSSISNNKTKGYNGFQVEWKQYAYVNPGICISTGVSQGVGPRFNTISNSSGTDTSKNRGYFENEIVEGSGFMFQDVDMGQAFYHSTTGGYIYCDGYTIRRANGWYYSPSYPASTSILFNTNLGPNGNRIVMRGDKLPTSTTLQTNYNNSYSLHNNSNFSAFVISDSGQVTTLGGGNSGQGTGGSIVADLDDGSHQINQVLESFACDRMAPLDCYYRTADGEFKVKDKGDDCWTNGGPFYDRAFDNGCYVLVSSPIWSLVNGHDFVAIAEWTNRILITFAACRDVFSHLFTNNWVNGTLYAWSFNNNVVYTSPFSNPPNAPSSEFCTDTILLHPTTNNFYYRSSPYKDDVGLVKGGFVGADRPSGGSFGQYNGNFHNLLYPTTIMDLGPRNNYMQEIVLSDEFDGYVASRLTTTTFQDVSELLQLFIITRLGGIGTINTILSFFGVGGPQIETFFNRNTASLAVFGTDMVDADYAQMLSINSELGVLPFEAVNYQDRNETLPNGSNAQDPVFITPHGDFRTLVFGVFYSSDSQLRDYLSPKRTIIDPTVTITNASCAFNYFPVKSQEVPFYQWGIKSGTDNTIFGSQHNDWDSDPIDGNYFFSYHYQDMAREQQSSRYFRTGVNGAPAPTIPLRYYTGYIYAINPSSNATLTSPTYSGLQDFEWHDTYWNQNPAAKHGRSITTGAPFYFYFGLKKGKSAYDRFAIKWVGTNPASFDYE